MWEQCMILLIRLSYFNLSVGNLKSKSSFFVVNRGFWKPLSFFINHWKSIVPNGRLQNHWFNGNGWIVKILQKTIGYNGFFSKTIDHSIALKKTPSLWSILIGAQKFLCSSQTMEKHDLAALGVQRGFLSTSKIPFFCIKKSSSLRSLPRICTVFKNNTAYFLPILFYNCFNLR